MAIDYWGWHLLVDCSNCSKTAIGSKEQHELFLKELVDKIDMVAYGAPILSHFALHDPTKGGFTIMQMIETSSIVGHFIDVTGEAYIDIFSCKTFSVKDATSVIQKYYAPTIMNPQMIPRKAY